MSDPETSYRPISCASYDVFEIAILRRSRLHLTWAEDNILHDQAVTALNLETLKGEEFLIARASSGDVLRIRLDRIRKVRPE